MSFLMRKRVSLNLYKCRIFMKNFRSENWYLLNRSCRRNMVVSHQLCLAAVAHQHKLNEDLPAVKSGKFKDAILIREIDADLSNIDSTVRRTGRISRRTVESVFLKVKNAELSFHTATHGLYLLRCCQRILEEAPSKRVELANEIWNMLIKLGCSFDIRHYNSLLRIYLDNNHHFSPTDFLAMLDANQIQPDKVTYLYLMEKYCNDGNLTGASEILEFMKEKKLPVNEAVFNSLIKGHVKIQDFSGAMNILDVMRASNLSPTADSYTAVASGYASKGDIEEMKSVLISAKNNGIRISQKHYFQLIDAAATSHHVHEIMDMIEDFMGYRQDCINLALNLIHRGIDDVAYRLILKSSDPQFNSGTNIFIKQLIKAGMETDKILHYCNNIFEQGLNKMIYLNAAKSANEKENFSCASAIFQAMVKKGVPVRLHYFLPMFSHYTKKKSAEGIYWTLKKMFEVGVCADFQLYILSVAPCVGMSYHPSDIISRIQESGQPVSTAVDAFFEFYCYHGKLNYALYLIQNYPVGIRAIFNIRQYLSHFEDLRQNSEYFQVLNYIMENVGINEKDSKELQGKFLAEVLLANQRIFDEYLRHRDSKVHFDQRILNVCKQILNRYSPNLVSYIRKLEDLHSDASPKAELTFEEENELLNKLKDQPSRRQCLLDILLHHIRRKNVDRVRQLLSSQEERGFDLTDSTLICSQLISLFTRMHDMEMTKKYMAALKEKHPTYKLDSVKVLEYAIMLIKFSKLEEALEFIKTECKELIYFGGKEVALKSVKRFLNAAAETADVGFVQNVQKLLLPHSKTLGSVKSFLEPLIKVHLHKHDLESAVNEYRNCVTNYKVSPCLGSLMKNCIYNDDNFNLQKVIDLTIANVGKMVAVNELAVSFVETGRLHQALKVIKSVGKEADIYLEELCSKMFDQNKVKQLEQLLLISKELQQVNREKIYYYLMKLYDNRNDHENALDVWKRLQADGITPSEEIEKLYNSLLKRNVKYAPVTHSPEEGIFPTESSAQLPKAEFLDSLNKDDIDTALSKLQKMKKGYIRLLSIEELSQFIDLLVQSKRVKDILPNVQVMSYIIEYPSEILKPLLQKYSENGDIDSVNEIISNFPDFTQKKIQARHFYYKTLISSGRYEDVIDDFEKSPESSEEGRKSFSTYAFSELLKLPDLRERAIKVAEKHLEMKFYLPIALVGVHYFINENYDKAFELLQLHPPTLDKVDAMILRSVKETENVTLGMQYVKFVNEMTAVRYRTKARAYGNLLEILVQKEMYDEAVALVKKAEEHEVSLHNYYQSTLIALKTVLENQNKPVPFNIPSEIKELGHENSE